MALVDGNGSTIAMVANATGKVVSSYAYDPFGKVSYGGSYITAYQYLGMENETLSGATWAYYGGGTYYSPVLGRPLTIQGPITSAGGFGSGPGAMVGGALPGGSGLGLGAREARQAEYMYAGEAAGFVIGSFIGGTEAGSIDGPEGAAIGAIIGGIAGLLEDLLGGGGPSYPWWWTREDTHPGGSPSTWAPILGLPAAYPPNQGKSAGTVWVGVASAPGAQPNPGFYPNNSTCQPYSLSVPNAEAEGEALGGLAGAIGGQQVLKGGPPGPLRMQANRTFGKMGEVLGGAVGRLLENGMRVGPPAGMCTPSGPLSSPTPGP